MTAVAGGPSSGRIHAILDHLIRERRRMLGSYDPDPSLVEANRLAIVYWQLQLRRASSADLAQARRAVGV